MMEKNKVGGDGSVRGGDVVLDRVFRDGLIEVIF